MRFRDGFIWIGGLAVSIALLRTDPDGGVSTGVIFLGLAVCVLALGFAHYSRKALFDYPEADMQALLKKAAETSTGAGLATMGLCIVIAALLMLFGSKVHAAERDAIMPVNARIYVPILKAEQQRFWPNHPAPELLAGLVEQESCISLTAKSCWSPTASLKSAREEGAGLGQITRAYRTDGSVRFDALADMRRRYTDLSDWNWGNVTRRPDLQLRAMVLMSRDNYGALHRLVVDSDAALAMADAAYNGGLEGVWADRRACGLKPGCDPQWWFGHVEMTCTKSRAVLYGQRSACDINRAHVTNVLRLRSAKYRRLMV